MKTILQVVGLASSSVAAVGGNRENMYADMNSAAVNSLQHRMVKLLIAMDKTLVKSHCLLVGECAVWCREALGCHRQRARAQSPCEH